MKKQIVIDSRTSSDDLAAEKAVEVALHFMGGLIAFGRDLFERLETNSLQAVRNRRIKRSRRRRIFVQMGLNNLMDRFAHEWLAAR